MTTLNEAKNAWRQAKAQFRKNTPTRTVYLGDGQGFATSNIVVPENPSLFYARESLSDKDFLVIPNYNARINPKFNLPVVVGYDQTNPNVEQILGTDLSAFPYQSATSIISGQAPHHLQHEFGGGDEVFVDPELIKVGLFTPDNPPTLGGYVQPFYYTHKTRGLTAFSGSRADDITPYIPSASGITRMVALSFNPDTGSLIYRTGNDLTSSSGASATLEELLAGGGSVTTPGNSASPPPVPGGEIPIATFALTNTTTSLNWSATSSAYYHSRLFLGKVDTDIYSRLDSLERKVGITTLPTTGANLFSSQVNENVHDADYFRLGRINDFQSSGSSPSWGTRLYFSGALGTQSWNSENSDGLWMARYNADNDVSYLRMTIGDNPTTSADAFQVGTEQSGIFTPRIDLTSNSNLRFHDSGYYVGFQPPALSGNQIWTLPNQDGSADEVLKTNGAGALSWGSPSPSITFDISLPFYDAEPARSSENNVLGGLLALATSDTLSTGTDIVVSKGTGKLLIVVNAGSDFDGTITVTGEKIDRNTGASTPGHTNTITVDALSTDNSTNDSNGNTKHSFAGAYITDDWFTGSVTLSTTTLNLSDVDVYHVSFHQFNDKPDITLDSFDVSLYSTRTSAEFDGYLFTLHKETGNKCRVDTEAELHLGADGETAIADKYWRLRRGNIAEALDGTTDGIWIDLHYSNSPAYIEDVTMIVNATRTV